MSPIKGDKAHAHSANVAKQLVDGDIVGDNPTDQGEVAEGLEQIARDQVPSCGGQEAVEEEPLAINSTMVTKTGICLRMKDIEERAADQISGPDCCEIQRTDSAQETQTYS